MTIAGMTIGDGIAICGMWASIAFIVWCYFKYRR